MTAVQRRPDALPAPSQQSPISDPVLRFARGEISRRQAMAELGDIGYSALIDKVVERGLKLPSLPDEELERMARDMAGLLASA